MNTKIIFPENFIFRGDHINEAINTVSLLISDKPKCYELDYSKVKNLQRGDLMILVAQLEKSAGLGNTFIRTGNFPDGRKVRKMLQEIMSVKQDKTVHWKIKETKEFENAKQLIPDIVVRVVKQLWKIKIREYFYDFNTFLTEIIGNAVEHGIKDNDINWWLDSDINKETQSITFTFVDMGKGIIHSHKKAGLPWKYKLSSDETIVLDSLFGRLRSSTGLPNRGRGMPQLREMIENGWVSDFALITNTVSLQYKNNNFDVTEIPNFRGTYYSWTINVNNFQKWKISR